jgi:Tol biopolymer transport system component
MRNGCVAVALVLLGATGVRADRVLTFSLPNALLLFGDYNQLRVVTAGGEQVLHPAVDEGYNRGYFALPSIAARQDGVMAWGFAVGWDETRRHDKARFALGLYSRANQQWRTYGDFDDIGDAGISSDGTKVAFVAREHGRLALQILNVATGALTEGPYQRGMWPRGTPSWSPDLTHLAVQVHRPDETSFVATLDLGTGELRAIGDGVFPRWSPDGTWIAFYSGRRCMVVHPDGTRSTIAMALKDGWFTHKEFDWGGPVWSPDSKQLLLNVRKNGERPDDVILLDLATGQTTTKSKNGLPIFGWVAQATSSSIASPID